MFDFILPALFLLCFSLYAGEIAVPRSPERLSNSATKSDCLKKVIGTNPRLPKFRNGRQGRAEFIKAFAPLAVQIQTQTGLPASIILAQAILETGGGTSSVAQSNNNYGGLSCALGDSDSAQLTSSSGAVPWNLEALTSDVWGDVGYKYKQRCGSTARGDDGNEGGRYLEFNHPYDSVLDASNAVLKMPNYNDPSSVYNPNEEGSGVPLSQKMKQWGVSYGIRESALRFKGAKNPAEKANMRENIIKMLQGVYATSSKDCSKCPKDNDEYADNLRGLIQDYKLDKYDILSTCAN